MHRAARMDHSRSNALERAIIDSFRWLGPGHPHYVRGERAEALAAVAAELPPSLAYAHLADAAIVVGELRAIGAQPFEAPDAMALSHRELLILDAISALQSADVGSAIEHLVEVADDGRVVGVLFSLRVMATRLQEAGFDVVPPGRRAFFVIEGGRDVAPATASEKRAQRAVLHAI